MAVCGPQPACTLGCCSSMSWPAFLSLPTTPQTQPQHTPLRLLYPTCILPTPRGPASSSLLTNQLEKEEKAQVLFHCLRQFPWCQYSQGVRFKLRAAEKSAHKTPEYPTISSPEPPLYKHEEF